MAENPDVPEEWKAVVGYEGWYEVSSLGRVRRTKSYYSTRVGRILKTQMRSGYPSVSLGRGKPKHATTHSLVMQAFCGPYPAGLEVNHRDGNPTNNALSNLEWASKSENALHGFRIGKRLPTTGERNGQAKLTEAQAKAILSAPAERGHGVLAKQFGISRQTVSDIRRGRRWAYLQGT